MMLGLHYYSNFLDVVIIIYRFPGTILAESSIFADNQRERKTVLMRYLH